MITSITITDSYDKIVSRLKVQTCLISGGMLASIIISVRHTPKPEIENN